LINSSFEIMDDNIRKRCAAKISTLIKSGLGELHRCPVCYVYVAGHFDDRDKGTNIVRNEVTIINNHQNNNNCVNINVNIKKRKHNSDTVLDNVKTASAANNSNGNNNVSSLAIDLISDDDGDESQQTNDANIDDMEVVELTTNVSNKNAKKPNQRLVQQNLLASLGNKCAVGPYKPIKNVEIMKKRTIKCKCGGQFTKGAGYSTHARFCAIVIVQTTSGRRTR
jgi:hypothetical protein